MADRRRHWDSYWGAYRRDQVRQFAHEVSRDAALRMIQRHHRGRLPQEMRSAKGVVHDKG
jgi:hypothetical protein